MFHFLRRQTQEQDTGDECLNGKACQLYEEKLPVCLNQSLDFGENENVEMKSFSSVNKLLQRLREHLPRYFSAFANTRGGFYYAGIDDISKTVLGCGQGMTLSELKEKIQEICDEARGRAVHLNSCTSQNSWSPEVKVIQVTSAPEVPAYLIAIKIPRFCCAVFEKGPESWEIDGDGEVSQLQCSDWFEKMQLQPSVLDKFRGDRFENTAEVELLLPIMISDSFIGDTGELSQRLNGNLGG
ncbi:ribonuclease SLFN12-like [Salminus brasiliensis]|uniref:ribonuclease SLFN12-like n=1 Tax=Salminus brasiliensis TaxID=930266 RepID=UPI003B835FAE